ncbi:MAG: AAA family ATPase [Oscillospiraceae bacterium]|nr:AAA family ATPase [Oscillospiraceae bacterium]
MSTAIAVTSGKGGTGKTTVTAAVSSCMAALGVKVLCIDLDAGHRDLMAVLGLEEETSGDFGDVIQGRSSLDNSAIPHPSVPGLYVLPAPSAWPETGIGKQAMATFLSYAKMHYDYVFLDSPTGSMAGLQLASSCADRALVISTCDPDSLSDAGLTAGRLSDLVPEAHLILNRVQPKIMRKLHIKENDAAEQTGLPLLGVIPEDRQVTIAAGKKQALVLATNGEGAAAACLDIANCLKGECVTAEKPE